ncbi:hypothetical protein JCM10450v2_001605 [Rhodotorula kratochvilovae]
MANLLEALLDILRGLFRTQFAILETALSFVRTVINEGTSIVDGVVRFVVGNILVLTVLGAAFIGWSWYQRGQAVQGGPAGAGRKKIA